jgi:phosphotransferase system HPr (HPr) family protein
MIAEKFTIKNPTGFHTRPARLFVDTANDDYPSCEVKVIKGDRTINGKSVLSMLTLGVKFGDEVTVQVSGEGEDEAVHKLGSIFEMIYQE